VRNRRWGGRGSNPRPADYEKADPAHVAAGRRPADRITAGQLGCAETGGLQPEPPGTGRMFSQCSHTDARQMLADLHRTTVPARSWVRVDNSFALAPLDWVERRDGVVEGRDGRIVRQDSTALAA